MKASGIEINGEKRIKVEFPFNREIVRQIKQIGGARWSQTLKAWHIPYSIGAFKQLKKSFPEIEYPGKSPDVTIHAPIVRPAAEITIADESQKEEVSIQVIGRKIIIKLPKNENDINFIRSLRYNR